MPAPGRLETQMLTEPSYFDFLMKHRCDRRARVPLAQAAGVLPERKRIVRPRRAERALDGHAA
jgi:hypothetical protein